MVYLACILKVIYSNAAASYYTEFLVILYCDRISELATNGIVHLQAKGLGPIWLGWRELGPLPYVLKLQKN